MDTQSHFSSPIVEMSQDQNDTRFQYLIRSEVSNVFLVIDLIIFVSFCCFCYMMFCMIKRELSIRKGQYLLKDMLITYSIIVPAAFIFMDLYFNILTRYERVPTVLSGHWFCGTFELVVHYSMPYIGGFSLYIAIIRYWRIVHSPYASEFEVARVRKLLWIIHLVIPGIISLFNAISNGKIDQIFLVDHCWSFQSVIENLSILKSEKLKDFFCLNREYEVAMHLERDEKTLITSSIRVLCGGLKIFHLILLSNAIELILYGLIMKYLNR